MYRDIQCEGVATRQLREWGHVRLQELATRPARANDIDAALERSLTHEWDAQIMTYPNERFPFNEWIRERIRKMGYPVEDLSNFHEVVPQADTYRVTKQLAPIPTCRNSGGC